MSRIPTASRERVTARDKGRCVRCELPGNHWHHRRGRSVRDEHTHCACNGVILCRVCHEWVHANPAQASTVGLIVHREVGEPEAVPIVTVRGMFVATCGGTWEGF